MSKYNFDKNKITSLFNIKYPLIQAGMVWCSGWELASAVSNSGGLGVIGAGSMHPEVLEEQITKCKAMTNRPFAVNLPLLYPQIDEHIKTIIEQKVPIVFTSAGNPKIWTEKLKSEGVIVVHVVSSLKFAQKAELAGVDAIVAEGFEAGGHNGRDETTTFCLLPLISDNIKIPIIAAGGISSGKTMLAAMVLGADAVQLGTRFVASEESSAHINFKEIVAKANEGDTLLSLKELTPVRLLKNKFFEEIQKAYSSGATPEELRELLSKGRAKKGMFEGDLVNGELEIGQVSANFDDILPAAMIVENIIDEYLMALNHVNSL